jgi:hypothetical protein
MQVLKFQELYHDGKNLGLRGFSEAKGGKMSYI